MGVAISYMGTKRELAGDVANAIASCRAGPVLDAFAGMCSVGEAVGTDRQVWVNDAQAFAYEVGRSLFVSSRQPLSAMSVADRYHRSFCARLERIANEFGAALEIESKLLDCHSFSDFEDRRRELAAEIAEALNANGGHYIGTFTKLYSDTYFGLLQCMEIDAIIGSIDWVGSNSNVNQEKRWLIIALGRAMLRISNSTGHFAQYLKPKVGSFRLFQRQRRRRIWDEWLLSQEEMSPVGNNAWRQQNRAFNEDAISLLRRLADDDIRPGVVYADPPYTNDQYSRYYHIFETLVLNDYPRVTGIGRYRESRFITQFSLKSKAAESIVRLGESVKNIGADLVFSYPTNGLAYRYDFDPESALRTIFSNVEVHCTVSHKHSTFGASKGPSKAQVTEQIYVARI